jgi:hypothetical protein
MMIKDSASFRDRSGYVFSWEGKIYRWISPEYLPKYRHLMDSGLYRALIDRRLMVAHKEVVLDGFDAGEGIVIQPKRIPFISYPYEWCFEQYQDAALATMDIQNLALEYGMILKDASAYNIQFLTGYAVLIDTLSFDFYQNDSPWGAYGQYCRHFFAPLMLMSNVDFRLGRLMQSFIDGIPLDLASALMKGGGITAQMHIHAHAKSVLKHNDDGKKGAVKQTVMKKSVLTAFCNALRKDTAKLQPMNGESEWGDYYAHTNYTDTAATCKGTIVRDMLGAIEPLKNVWDLGANDGRYSRIVNECGAHVVAFDIDENAVGANWREVKVTHRKMLPLILDLSAPSPSIGFANEERQTIRDRQRPDCILMLAVIHHMAISNNLPFGKIAEWIAGMTDCLIIEFVPKEDSQVQVLLATRVDIFPDYDEAHFEIAFGKFFQLKAKMPIDGSKRTMYLWKK